MDVLAKYSYEKVNATYKELRAERSEWEADWRLISNNLLPGRGVYQTYSKPRKRKLTSPNIINTVGEDSLYVLTSGLHGRLTSPALPWFKLDWGDDQLNEIEPLKQWLQDSEKILHKGLHKSNFYSIINSYYIEYAGFGTGCLYVGEDTYNSDSPFRFELLTAGEYCFSLGADGLTDVFVRTIFLSKRQLFERFPKTVSNDVKTAVKKNDACIDKVDLAIVEYVVKDSYQDKEYLRLYYEVTSSGKTGTELNQQPLEISGFYENPYPLARWGTIGSDVYGIGPGSRAVPDIKRLQEMEKAFLMATHKGIDPPLYAPAKMRGKLNSLPGGKNYYSNPNETVNELYRTRFDYQGVSAAIDRVEQRIQKNFFNDVFLTATRDPNASPLKAAQVNAQEQEKLLRLGPVVERLFSELYSPIIRRCFNIMKRKELFPLLDPELEAMVGDFEIALISPMAIAQRSVKSQGTDAFMGFVGQAAQFDQSIIDNINVDEAARQRADIEGVDMGILRPIDEVKKIRADRAKQAAADRVRAEQAANAQLSSSTQNTDAITQKTQAQAGQILTETQQTAKEAGLA